MGVWARLIAGAVISTCALMPSRPVTAASVIEITGVPFTSGFPGYSGGNVSKNNVINFGPSGISDDIGGKAWFIGGAVLSKVDHYGVDWYFSGAESGDTIKFLSAPVYFTETNQNNHVEAGNDPGFQAIGTSTGSGAGSPISFALLDVTRNAGVSNGQNNMPGAFIASLMFAYLEPDYEKKKSGTVLEGWKVTKKVTDWFAFAFNDPGSSDKDFDDFVGVGHVHAMPGQPVAQTPVPGALPLMASALGAGSLMRWWRRRRQQRLGLA